MLSTGILVQVQGRTDQGQVAQSLGEVAQLLALLAQFFGIQPDVIGIAHHLVEALPRLVYPSGPRQALNRVMSFHS